MAICCWLDRCRRPEHGLHYRRIIGTSAPHALSLTPDVIPENSPFGTTIATSHPRMPTGPTHSLTRWSPELVPPITLALRFRQSAQSQHRTGLRTEAQLFNPHSHNGSERKVLRKAFTVSVSNVNEAPVVAGLDVSTYSGVAELIPFSAVDPEGDAFT